MIRKPSRAKKTSFLHEVTKVTLRRHRTGPYTMCKSSVALEFEFEQQYNRASTRRNFFSRHFSVSFTQSFALILFLNVCSTVTNTHTVEAGTGFLGAAATGRTGYYSNSNDTCAAVILEAKYSKYTARETSNDNHWQPWEATIDKVQEELYQPLRSQTSTKVSNSSISTKQRGGRSITASTSVPCVNRTEPENVCLRVRTPEIKKTPALTRQSDRLKNSTQYCRNPWINTTTICSGRKHENNFRNQPSVQTEQPSIGFLNVPSASWCALQEQKVTTHWGNPQWQQNSCLLHDVMPQGLNRFSHSRIQRDNPPERDPILDSRLTKKQRAALSIEHAQDIALTAVETRVNLAIVNMLDNELCDSVTKHKRASTVATQVPTDLPRNTTYKLKETTQQKSQSFTVCAVNRWQSLQWQEMNTRMQQTIPTTSSTKVVNTGKQDTNIRAKHTTPTYQDIDSRSQPMAGWELQGKQHCVPNVLYTMELCIIPCLTFGTNSKDLASAVELFDKVKRSVETCSCNETTACARTNVDPCLFNMTNAYTVQSYVPHPLMECFVSNSLCGIRRTTALHMEAGVSIDAPSPPYLTQLLDLAAEVSIWTQKNIASNGVTVQQYQGIQHFSCTVNIISATMVNGVPHTLLTKPHLSQSWPDTLCFVWMVMAALIGIVEMLVFCDDLMCQSTTSLYDVDMPGSEIVNSVGTLGLAVIMIVTMLCELLNVSPLPAVVVTGLVSALYSLILTEYCHQSQTQTVPKVNRKRRTVSKQSTPRANMPKVRSRRKPLTKGQLIVRHANQCRRRLKQKKLPPSTYTMSQKANIAELLTKYTAITQHHNKIQSSTTVDHKECTVRLQCNARGKVKLHLKINHNTPQQATLKPQTKTNQVDPCKLKLRCNMRDGKLLVRVLLTVHTDEATPEIGTENVQNHKPLTHQIVGGGPNARRRRGQQPLNERPTYAGQGWTKGRDWLSDSQIQTTLDTLHLQHPNISSLEWTRRYGVVMLDTGLTGMLERLGTEHTYETDTTTKWLERGLLLGDTPYVVVGDQRHWRIVLIDGTNREIYTYDPYGTGFPTRLKNALQQATDNTGLPWTHKDVQYRLQNDSHNCGIWVLFLAHTWIQYVEAGTHQDRTTDFIQHLHRALLNVDIELNTNIQRRGAALRTKYLQIHNANPGTEAFYGIRGNWTTDGSDLEILDNCPATTNEIKNNTQCGPNQAMYNNQTKTTPKVAPQPRPKQAEDDTKQKQHVEQEHAPAPPSPTKRKQPYRLNPTTTKTKPKAQPQKQPTKRKTESQQKATNPNSQQKQDGIDHHKKQKGNTQQTLFQCWQQTKPTTKDTQPAEHTTQHNDEYQNNLPTDSGIKTLAWNCNTLNSEALHTVDKLTNEIDPDIIVLTETKIRKKSKQYINSRLRETYRTFASHLDKQAGVVLGIHNKYDGQGTYVTQHTLPKHTKGYLTHVTIYTSETQVLQVLAVYMPHDKEEGDSNTAKRAQIYDTMQRILHKARELNQPVLMIGDWNAVTKPNQRHTGIMTPTDLQMLRFVSSNELTETNTDQHTRTIFKQTKEQTVKESSKLDTALLMHPSNKPKKLRMDVLPLEGKSDHNPILVTTNQCDTPLLVPPPKPVVTPQPKEELKRPWTKEHQEAFRLAVLEQTQRQTQYMQDVIALKLDIATQQGAVEDLLAASREAAMNTLPTTTRLGIKFRPRKASTKLNKLWNKKSALKLAIHWAMDQRNEKNDSIQELEQASSTFQKARKLYKQALQQQDLPDFAQLLTYLEEKLEDVETKIKETNRADYKQGLDQRPNSGRN